MCEDYQCFNGGVCKINYNPKEIHTVKCTCAYGYHGKNCEKGKHLNLK